MKMKNLAVVCLTIWHKEAATAELAIVNNDYTLEHMEVKAFGHAIKCAHILIKRADNIKIASRTEVRS